MKNISILSFILILSFPSSESLTEEQHFDYDCYFQEVESLTTNVSTKANDTICKSGYFKLLKDDFKDPEEDLESNSEKSLECSPEVVLCCPKIKPQGERLSAIRPILWPNELRGTLSRAFMECHSEEIPGLDSIRFLLYTEKNAGIFEYKELNIDVPDSIVDSNFLINAPVKIIIHGFMSSAFIGPGPALRIAYSTIPEKMNIITVHWEALANLVTASGGICYDVASQSTKTVGEKTARLIEYLVKNNFATLDNFHILGHSLGSHCAGFTGKYLRIGKLPRITAFDPARPHFNDKNPGQRLDLTDALFVDVIHTATKQWKLLGTITGGLLPFPVGIRKPLGHRDFYPNKGTHQPGCLFQLKKLPVLCSHSRSYAYYADSIRFRNEKIFLAEQCEDLKELETGYCSINRDSKYRANTRDVIMGEYTPKARNETRTIYYVKTNSRSPFPLDSVIG